ncbi:MAG: Ivy family c-type lysozyme inhibitor [Betaproteobacteria bacterium]
MGNHKRWHIALVVAVAGIWVTTTLAADSMVTTDDLLKSPKFKSVYAAALGPKGKERWLSTMTNSALVREVVIAGDRFQVATPCKPHDCGDNNLLLLFSPAKGVVFGKLYEKGKTTLLGAPDPGMISELEKMWKKEFRQQ